MGLPKRTPRTIESTRVPNDDFVDINDQEVQIDESLDELSSYFNKEVVPKILITASHNPHTKTIKFCRELRNVIPNSEFRFRKKASIKKMVNAAVDRGFTDIVIINEDWRKPSKFIISNLANSNRISIDALLHIHLPDGPTAYYRLSSIRYCKEIKVCVGFVFFRNSILIS